MPGFLASDATGNSCKGGATGRREYDRGRQGQRGQTEFEIVVGRHVVIPCCVICGPLGHVFAGMANLKTGTIAVCNPGFVSYIAGISAIFNALSVP